MCKSTVRIITGCDEDFEEVLLFLEKHTDVKVREKDVPQRSLVVTIEGVPSPNEAKRFIEAPGGPLLEGVTQVYAI